MEPENPQQEPAPEEKRELPEKKWFAVVRMDGRFPDGVTCIRAQSERAILEYWAGGGELGYPTFCGKPGTHSAQELERMIASDSGSCEDWVWIYEMADEDVGDLPGDDAPRSATG